MQGRTLLGKDKLGGRGMVTENGEKKKNGDMASIAKKNDALQEPPLPGKKKWERDLLQKRRRGATKEGPEEANGMTPENQNIQKEEEKVPLTRLMMRGGGDGGKTKRHYIGGRKRKENHVEKGDIDWWLGGQKKNPHGDSGDSGIWEGEC